LGRIIFFGRYNGTGIIMGKIEHLLGRITGLIMGRISGNGKAA
jgi:hypothetical protein